MLLSLDPGQNSPGVALFDASGLRAAHRIEIPSEWIGFEPGQRWMTVAHEIAAWTRNAAGPVCIDCVAFEKPQWYQRGKSKGDPNQLVGIAGVAANVTGMLLPSTVVSPEPAQWIGQLSKECPTCVRARKYRKGTGVKTFARDCPDCHGSAWETPRGRRIRARLRSDELVRVPDQNDAIDAVGIGLWVCGRLEPRSVFSNGRDGR